MRKRFQRILVLVFALFGTLGWARAAGGAEAPGAVAFFSLYSSTGEIGRFHSLKGAGSLSEIIEQLVPGSQTVQKRSGSLHFNDLILSRPVSKDRRAADWRKLVETGAIDTARRDVSLVALGNDGLPILTVELFNAWPSTLVVETPASDASPVETLTLVNEGSLLKLSPATAVAKGLISSPADGAVYYVPSSLPVTVQLVENQTAATQVRFLANDQLVGTDTTPGDGFSFSWSAPAPGFYTLKAEIVSGTEGLSLTPAVALQVKSQIQLALGHQQIAENLPIKSAVGLFTVSGTTNASVSLASGAGDAQNSSFSIDSMKRLLTEAVFDHESLAVATIRVKAIANDGIGGVAEQVFAIGITDGPEESGPRLKQDNGLVVAYDAEANSTRVDLRFGDGIHGRSYTVEVSGDLKTWEPLGRYVADETGSFSLQNTVSGKPDRRFWRIRW